MKKPVENVIVDNHNSLISSNISVLSRKKSKGDWHRPATTVCTLNTIARYLPT